MNHELLAELLAEQEDDLQLLCKEHSDMVHIISALPSSNFRDFDWERHSFPMRLTRLREIFSGIKTLHGKNIIHGNISEDTTFIVSENPLRAAVGGLGELLEVATSTNGEGMGSVTREPTKPNDIQDLAGVALKILLPTGDSFTDSGLTEEEIWHELTTSFLTVLASEGRIQARVARVINDMLSNDETLRPTAAAALAALPEYSWTMNAYKKLSNYSSPQKDAQKRIRDVHDDHTTDGDLQEDIFLSPPLHKKAKHLSDSEAYTSPHKAIGSCALNVQAALAIMKEMMKNQRELNNALQEGVTINDLKACSQGEDANTFDDLKTSESEGGGFQILYGTTIIKNGARSALSAQNIGHTPNSDNGGVEQNYPTDVENPDHDQSPTEAKDNEANDASDERYDSPKTSPGGDDGIQDDQTTEGTGNSSESSSNSFGDVEDFTQELYRVSEELRAPSQTQPAVTTSSTQTQQEAQRSCSSEESEEE